MPNVCEAIKTMSKKNEEGITKADSQEDMGPVDSKRIKKDALYKPLLRKFRNFLRKLLDSRGLSKGCHYWTAERMRRKVWKFMHELELPACFMDLKSLNMMMLMLFPTIAKKQRDKKRFCEELEFYFHEIRLPCYEVFKENNIKKRKAFFSEPLIKYLWNLFIVYKPEITINHLRRTRSHPYEGEARYKKLISDILDFELRFNMKILPDQARKDEAITLFSPEEAELDLQENGKFNKRNAEVIRKELARLNRIKPLDKETDAANKANEDSDIESDFCLLDGN